MTIKTLDGLMATISASPNPEPDQPGTSRMQFLRERLERIANGEILVVGWVSRSEARELLTLMEDRLSALRAIANGERLSTWISKDLAQQLMVPASLLSLVIAK